jgi:hypothetical protein
LSKFYILKQPIKLDWETVHVGVFFRGHQILRVDGSCLFTVEQRFTYRVSPRVLSELHSMVLGSILPEATSENFFLSSATMEFARRIGAVEEKIPIVAVRRRVLLSSSTSSATSLSAAFVLLQFLSSSLLTTDLVGRSGAAEEKIPAVVVGRRLCPPRLLHCFRASLALRGTVLLPRSARCARLG